MHQRTRLHAFSVIPCLALSLFAQAPDPGPASNQPAEVAPIAKTQTTKIPAHMSRWDYPKEVEVAAGTQIHFVVKGDTLWDLGRKYLGNPFAWPQIWELNKWVHDPHWIYPGDPILVDGSRSALAPGEAQDQDEEVAELQPDFKRTPRRTRDEYGYSFQDFIQLPFLAPHGTAAYVKSQGAVQIVGCQDATKQMQGDGDVVYLNGGTNQGFKAGDRLVAFQVVSRKFYHPDDHRHLRPMGDILQQAGVLRITSLEATRSIAIVERSLDGLLLGFYAAPFTEPASIVTKLRTDIGNPIQLKAPTAKIIFARQDRTVAAAGDIVIVDQGSKAGLKVGDTLLVARTNPMDSTRKPAAQGSTTVYLGQMMVVRTEEQTATCRLLRTRFEVLIGDIVTR